MAKTPYRNEEIDTQTVAASPYAGELRFECEGLRADTFGSGFILEGVSLQHLDYRAVIDLVKSTGLSAMEAEILVEDFAALVQTKVLAKALAERMREVRFG